MTPLVPEDQSRASDRMLRIARSAWVTQLVAVQLTLADAFIHGASWMKFSSARSSSWIEHQASNLRVGSSNLSGRAIRSGICMRHARESSSHVSTV